jgi:hypothetical protein
MLRRRLTSAVLVALAVALGAPAGAHATGVFSEEGSKLIYTASLGDTDQIAGFETSTSIRFTRFGGADIGPGTNCVFVGNDSNTVDCIKLGISSVELNLADGNDVASVSSTLAVPVVFNGGTGNDGLFGGGGLDRFDGGSGDDNIVARDGRAEQVICGSGTDTAITDDADHRDSCEEVEGDADGDGVRHPADCDDTNPGIHPGAVDVAENGVDEDCSGTDAINSDRDGDGTPRPQDCDDTNAAIRPGAREVIGNRVDENCDTLVESFPPLTGSVSGTWGRIGKRTRNLTLRAKGFPAGTRIELRCSGSRRCPRGVVRRRVRSARRSINLHAALGARALAAGARLDLSFNRTARIGRVLRYRIGAPGLPDVSFLCRPPGGTAGPC